MLGTPVSTCISSLSSSLPSSHSISCYSTALPIAHRGHAFHHLSPPVGDTVDCLPSSPPGSLAFFPANRIPSCLGWSIDVLRGGEPSPSPRLLAQTFTATGLGWPCDYSCQWHMELLGNVVLCYLDKHEKQPLSLPSALDATP